MKAFPHSGEILFTITWALSVPCGIGGYFLGLLLSRIVNRRLLLRLSSVLQDSDDSNAVQILLSFRELHICVTHLFYDLAQHSESKVL